MAHLCQRSMSEWLSEETPLCCAVEEELISQSDATCKKERDKPSTWIIMLSSYLFHYLLTTLSFWSQSCQRSNLTHARLIGMHRESELCSLCLILNKSHRNQQITFKWCVQSGSVKSTAQLKAVWVQASPLAFSFLFYPLSSRHIPSIALLTGQGNCAD